jgi:glycine cleavage system H protein
MSVPAQLRYTAHDEWIAVDGDIVTVGITDFAQDALGELVHIELPDVGTTFAAGAAVCEVESVKAVAEVYTPVGGEIVAVNGDLDGDEGAINSDPYGSWLFKIKASDLGGLSGLLDAAAYEAKIG